MDQKRNFGLDLIRATAVILVVLAHSLGRIELISKDLFYLFGTVGVELFFVLSGFLIGRILIKTVVIKTNFKNIVIFWKRRWYRTLPNYYLFLCLGVFVAIVAEYPIKQFLYYFIFVQNFAWEMPTETSIMGITWSLTIEEWFYLLFPLLLYFFRRAQVKHFFLMATLVMLCFSFFIRIYYSIQPELLWDNNIRKVVVARLDSLMIGVLLAYLSYTSPKLLEKYKKILFYLGTLSLTILLATFIIIDKDASVLFKIFFFPLLSIAIACLFPLIHSWEYSDASFYTKNLQSIIKWFSLHAYTIYLSHRLLLFIVPPYTNPVIFLTSYYFVCFVVAHFVYKFYEKPIMDLRPSDGT